MSTPQQLHRVYSTKALRGFKQYQIAFSATSRRDGSLSEMYEYLVQSGKLERALRIGGSERMPAEHREIIETKLGREL